MVHIFDSGVDVILGMAKGYKIDGQKLEGVSLFNLQSCGEVAVEQVMSINKLVSKLDGYVCLVKTLKVNEAGFVDFRSGGLLLDFDLRDVQARVLLYFDVNARLRCATQFLEDGKLHNCRVVTTPNLNDLHNWLIKSYNRYKNIELSNDDEITLEGVNNTLLEFFDWGSESEFGSIINGDKEVKLDYPIKSKGAEGALGGVVRTMALLFDGCSPLGAYDIVDLIMLPLANGGVHMFLRDGYSLAVVETGEDALGFKVYDIILKTKLGDSSNQGVLGHHIKDEFYSVLLGKSN